MGRTSRKSERRQALADQASWDQVVRGRVSGRGWSGSGSSWRRTDGVSVYRDNLADFESGAFVAAHPDGTKHTHRYSVEEAMDFADRTWPLPATQP